MMAVRCVALTAVAVAGADHGDEAGADAQRAARAEAGGARALGRAGDDDGVAARVLVRVERAARDSCARHSAGRLAKVRGPISSSTRAGMPMSASRTSPHSARPGSSRWPGFRRKKVTVRVACTTGPAAGARRAVEAARHVDGHHRLARGIDGRHHVGRHALQRPRQAGAEQGIDDEVGAGERRPASSGSIAPAPAPRHLGRIALERLAAAEQPERARDSPARAAAAPPRSRRRRCCRARRPPRSRRPRPPASSAAASATARPAFSISASPGTPCGDRQRGRRGPSPRR